MIRLAVFDIDRTLIAPALGEMAPETAAAIRYLREKGIKTVIASGRQMHLIPEELRALDFDYYILSNGSYVMDREEHVLSRETVDDDTVHEFLQEMIRRDLPINLRYTTGMAPGNPNRDLLQAMQDYWKSLNIARKPPKVMQQVITPPEGEQPVSCLAYIPVADQPYFISRFPQLDFLSVFEGPMCDINKAGVSKASGIERICAMTGISMEEAIAFGDDRNDLEMVAKAGIGVAMGNAIQAVKDAADYITDSCEDLGVVNALGHFGLLD